MVRRIRMLLGICLCSAMPVQAAQAPKVADAIRTEATRSNQDSEGRPLPLLSHWCCGNHPRSKGWAPAEQLKLIEQGHYLLPWFAHPPTDEKLSERSQEAFREYYEQPLEQARQWKLPVVFVSTQWEHRLSAPPYLGLPPEQNPNVVTVDGKVLPKVCPFGPVEPWRTVGATWTANPQMKQIQEWYPDPPAVIFLSNNEHGKLVWTEVEKSKRYLDKFGPGRDEDFRRKAVADGWIERYRALQQGLHDGLVNSTWKERATFVGYDAFGPPHFARWGGWTAYSLHSAGRISPDPLMWDGGSPSYYTHDWNVSTDYKVWSPQIEFMNLVFMQQEALRLNPKFWLELSIWDGYDGPDKGRPTPSKRTVYERAGQTFTPQRYAGFVQFGMWLLRPRAVREFRGWTFPAEDGMAHFLALADAVDRVHNQPLLREFWRRGELVPNRAHPHPYQAAIPAEYREAERWFLLDANVNPQTYPWALSQEIPVFSVAFCIGQPPARRWLVYAHSPLQNRSAVKITIPDFRAVPIDVLVGGSFYVVTEENGSVNAVP